MVYRLIHLLIVTVYLLCPVVALVRATVLRVTKNHRRPLRRFRLTALLGVSAGVVTCVFYAAAMNGRLIFTQVLIAGYLATSLMLLLHAFDQLLWHGSRWLLGLSHLRGPMWWFNLRATFGLLVRAVVVFCVGLPYVLATVMTYRPRVNIPGTPVSICNWNYQRVEFPATDGTRIVGWWIPALSGESTNTVLLCPDSSSDKASQLSLVNRLLADRPANEGRARHGYNVLVIDFRAHGESGGQLCSFGDLERQDVLGAMRWLRAIHPRACKKVAGLGVSTGGAALLAAAADDSPEGQNIDAVAVYDTFDRLDHMTRSMTAEFIPQPLAWCVDHFGLPMAGYQVGTNLSAFAPASDIKAIWPRPVLVIHGINDEVVPFDQGQALYDSALEPKMNFWINRCNYGDALKNKSAKEQVRQCFDLAERVI